MDLQAGGTSLGHLLGNGFRKPLFLRICRLAGFPWASCWEMASSGHFSYGGVRWRDLFGPIARKWLPEATFCMYLYAGGTPAGKWPPEATFRIDLYTGGTSSLTVRGTLRTIGKSRSELTEVRYTRKSDIPSKKYKLPRSKK